MKPGLWAQELMWVRRNEQGVIIGVDDKLPTQGDFVPTFPRLMKKKVLKEISSSEKNCIRS